MTMAMLFPTSMVDMNCCGFLNKNEIMLVVIVFFCLSISNFSLSAETNAISMPEKNPDSSSVMTIMTIVWISISYSTGNMPVGLEISYCVILLFDTNPMPSSILSFCSILMCLFE